MRLEPRPSTFWLWHGGREWKLEHSDGSTRSKVHYNTVTFLLTDLISMDEISILCARTLQASNSEPSKRPLIPF